MCGDRWRSLASKGKPVLSFDKWRSIIDSAQKLHTMIISITGGEPLLHPDFFCILDYIKKAGIATHICTNGTLLSNKNVAELAKANIHSISISLDSDEPSMHNYLRGSDCFDKVVSGIRRLRKAMPGTKLNVNFTLCRLNAKKITGIVRLGKELGLNQINFAPIHTNLQHKYKPEGSFRDLIFDKNDIPMLSKEIARLKAAARSARIRVSSSSFLNGIPRFYAASSHWQACFAGYASCSISPWGDVSPCADIDSNENIWNTPLHIIWKSKSFQRLREEVRTCNRQCWDTTNAELAVRFTVTGLLREFPNIIQDLLIYSRIKK